MEPYSPRTRRYYLPACALILLLASFQSAYAQDFTLSDSNVTVRTSRVATVTVSSTAALSEGDVSFTAAPADLLNIGKSQAAPQSVALTLTAKQQPGEVKVSVTVGSTTKPLTVTIVPFVNTAAELATDLPNLPDALTLSRNEPKVFPVATGVSVQSNDLLVASTRDDIVTATFDGQQLRIRAVGTGTAQVSVSNVARVSLKQITVTVKEAPEFARVNPTDITLPTSNADVDWTSAFRLFGLNSQDVTDELKGDLTPVSDRPEVLLVNPNKTLRALKKGTATLRLVAPDGKVIGPVIVTVKPTQDDVGFSSDTGSFILRQNQTIRVTATIKNTAGETADDARVAKWDYPPGDTDSKLRITFSEVPGTNIITVTALPDATPGPATLRAFFGPLGAQSRDVTFTVQTFNITDFKPLQIRFDLMDTQTARDLFGKKAADDFFIAKIRLFNKLRDATNTGNSILVYGESLEVNVALEIDEGKGWQKLEAARFKELFGTTDPNAPDLTDKSPQVLCSARTTQPNFIARYRPMTFEMIANTHDRRDERTLRSRVLLGLNGASSLASFVTSIAVPGPSSDLPTGLEKFRNLFIPGFERLFPSMREVQRQNIISMVLRPLEEVPFGSDITRVVFFPRKPIRGIIPQASLRIGAISISDACAEVAIIKKNNQP